MKSLIIYFVSIFCVSVACLGQKKSSDEIIRELKIIGSNAYRNSEFMQASLIFDSISELYKEGSDYYFDYKNKSITALSHIDISKSYERIRDLVSASKVLINNHYSQVDKAIIINYISILEKVNHEEFLTLGLSFLRANIGNSNPNVLSLMGEINSRLSNYFFSISDWPNFINSQLRLLDYATSEEDSIGILVDIGLGYQNLGEFEEAKIVLFKALQLLSYFPKYGPEIYNSIGGIYLFQKKYDNAFLYYKKSLSMRDNLLSESGRESLRIVYNNIGNCFKKINQQDSAFYYYNLSLKEAEYFFGKKSEEAAFSYNNLGNFYLSNGKLVEALNSYIKGLEIKESIDGYIENDYAYSLYNVGITYGRIGQQDSAIHYISKAIIFLRNQIPQDSIISIDDIRSPSDYVYAYYHLGMVYHGRISYYGDLNFLLSLSCLKEAKRVIDFLISSCNSEVSMLNLSTLRRQIICELAKVYLTFRDNAGSVDSLFELAHLVHNQLIERSNEISHHPYRNIRSLDQKRRIEAANILTKIKKIEDLKTMDNQLLIDNYSRLFDLIIDSLDLFNDERGKLVENRAPKNGKKYVIGDSTLVLEYLIIGDTLLCFSLNRDSLKLSVNEEVSSIIEGVKIVKKEFSRYNFPEKELKKVSDYLLVNIKLDLATINRIVIIPDDFLVYFPFELIDRNIKDDKWRLENTLLMNDYSVTYNFSFNNFNSDHETEFEYAFIGFSPGNLGEQSLGGLSSLDYADKEIRYLESYFRSNNLSALSFCGEQSNISNFYSYCDKSSILHIASHTIFFNDFAGLLLSFNQNSGLPEILDYFDIANYPISAKLVVLSSCNTIFGDIVLGEGLINIVRAFAFNDVTNILFTTNYIPDRETMMFMAVFYQYLDVIEDVGKCCATAKKYLINTEPRVNPIIWLSFNVISKE